MSRTDASCEETELGRGRSGTVLRHRDDNGRLVARKVFGSSGLTRVVQTFFLGAPNPYEWSADAVRCAVLRRRIMADLVSFWLGSRMRVAWAHGMSWCERGRAFGIDTDLVEGRHAALHHPLSLVRSDEVAELTGELMPALQRHLRDAGLDGLMWQAGYGNPVALGNFMLETLPGGKRRWVWIDLESGVPALFPANPLALFRYYLPRSIRFRRPLFDDIDTDRLHNYVWQCKPELADALGNKRLATLKRRIRLLVHYQHRWKSTKRSARSIGYALMKGRIDADRAHHYSARPIRWYVRLCLLGVASLFASAFGVVRRAGARLRSLRPAHVFRVVRPMLSTRGRSMLARRAIDERIARWEKRRQIDPIDAAVLRARLARERSSDHLADFGVHMAIKPVVKITEWWALPMLVVAGLLEPSGFALLAVALGCMARTAYTLTRLLAARTDRPWVALVVGAIPVVGNLAYPVQVLYSGSAGGRSVARFVLYDVITTLGRRLPIWGGVDTGAEHAANRLAHRLVDALSPQAGPADEVAPLIEAEVGGG